jgi:hypothetical protein
LSGFLEEFVLEMMISKVRVVANVWEISEAAESLAPSHVTHELLAPPNMDLTGTNIDSNARTWTRTWTRTMDSNNGLEHGLEQELEHGLEHGLE